MSRNVLLVFSENTVNEAWIKLAERLAGENGVIHLRGMVTIPEGVSLSEGTSTAQKMREGFDSLSKARLSIHDQTDVRVDYRPLARTLDEIKDLDISLTLIDWQGPQTTTGGLSTNEILQNAPCDVALLRGTSWQNEGPVLLSLRGGPNLKLGVQVALAMAGEEPITLFHAFDKAPVAPSLRNLIRSTPQITRVVTAKSAALEGILRETVGHKAVVMGATFYQPQGKTSMAGKVVDLIYERTPLSLTLIRAWQPEGYEFPIAEAMSISEESLSDRVDRWFAEKTFDSSEFADLPALLALKEKQGVTISVALPALNEAATVGKVISTIKTALMDDVPLVDEIVLIDSDSTDDTVAIAKSMGIPVYTHPEILPEAGSYRGKGEALWKSLHVLKGDIIAWIDTDITNIHPRFIYGILGPLLKYPNVQYVKGFYQRPIKVGDQLQAYGGGRVTELVVRPLFNLFYPELSGFVQPLAGEYAGRRSALEQVPFFSGYGVETSLLIDLHDRFGLDGIAQTNLEQRVHHNQPLVGLSKMSFAILQVFISRLEKRYEFALLDRANRSMKLIKQTSEHLSLEMSDISDVERPPIITVPAYRVDHGVPDNVPQTTE